MLDTSELLDALGGGSNENDGIDKDVVERLRFDDALEIPARLTDADLWANYVNDDLYAMDRKVREYLKRTRYLRSSKGGMKTTAAAVFAWIYGRRATPHDSYACRLLNMLLRYYCTRYTNQTTYKGRPVPRVYKFSRYAGLDKRPYSLRLRLELIESGEWKGGKDFTRRGSREGQDKLQRGGRGHREACGDADGGGRDDSRGQASGDQDAEERQQPGDGS